jgi:ion channel
MGAVLLLFGVWLEISRLILDRLVYGFADSYFRRTSLRAWVGEPGSVHLDEVAATRQDKIVDVVRLFCGIVGVVIFAYAAVYSAVDAAAGKTGAFTEIPRDRSRIFHLLYFSIITVGTVGYGDIVPKQEYLLARLLTASEVIAGAIAARRIAY